MKRFTILSLFLLLFSCNRPKTVKVCFTFDNRLHNLPIKTLSVAGDFNHWDRQQYFMQDKDHDRVWQTSIKLRPGWHYYRFNLNGKRWIRDFSNPLYGGPYSNSMIYVDSISYPRVLHIRPLSGQWLYTEPDSFRIILKNVANLDSTLTYLFKMDGNVYTLNGHDSLLTLPLPQLSEGEHRWHFSIYNKEGTNVYFKSGLFFVNLVNLVNQRPVADAGYMQIGRTGRVIKLNGGKSFDPDFEPLVGFEWKIIKSPGKIKLEGTRTPFPVFKAHRAGEYDFVLTVRDSSGAMDKDTTRVLIFPSQDDSISFVFRSQNIAQKVHSVSVVGEFNRWAKGTNPLRPTKDSARWQSRILLKPGQYEYKFVINDSLWVPDADNPLRVADGWKGYNSILKIKDPFGWDVQLRTIQDRGYKIAPVQKHPRKAKLIWYADVQNPFRVIRTRGEDLLFDAHNPTGIYYYYAILKDGSYYSQPFTVQIDHFKKTTVSDYFSPPAWADTAIVYELFVRNFSSSGDLSGLIKRLPYLKLLGVNTLWLMPVYQSPTPHGYAPTDLFGINRDYGSLDDYRHVIEVAHQNHLRVIFDFVANHLSDQHRFVSAAADNVRSPLRHWFYWRADGQWGYHNDWDTLVNLNYHTAMVRHYILKSAEFWASQGVDGFRCDVAWAVPHDFWKDFRRTVKAINPDILLIDEVLPRQPAYHDDEFDMSYDTDFYGNLLDVLQNKKPLSSLSYGLQKTRTNYPRRAMNLRYMENHDLPRFLLRFGPKLTEIAAVILLTIPGTPMLYYGQENGATQMRPKFSGNIDQKWFDFYSTLIKLRKNSAALSRGEMQTVRLDDKRQIWHYVRSKQGQTFHVIINLSDQKEKVNINVKPTTIYIKDNGLEITRDGIFIKPKSFIIYK